VSSSFDAVVFGGGFYGARLALALRARNARVLLVEREPALLRRASLLNQARVHAGYHYPRSILTSLRSRQNCDRFLAEYADCIEDRFPHYYAIARNSSNVTAKQFAEFCRRIDAPAEPAPSSVVRIFDPRRVEAVFVVRECAFDAVRLARRVVHDLAAADVSVELSTEAVACLSRPDGPGLTITLRGPGGQRTVTAALVINATYASLNTLQRDSGDPIPLKYELAELAIVDPPPSLGGAAVTVMDGPFFSLMPYPPRGAFTLSHVRYTPHYTWQEGDGPLAHSMLRAPRASRYLHMSRDAELYLPAMRDARYLDSLFEVKALMPLSENDDSRPILFHRDPMMPAFISVLGAKIDSVYDVEERLGEAVEESRALPGWANNAD
jgi:glycine/D-amino acid oxidase-like deaminating enzyme